MITTKTFDELQTMLYQGKTMLMDNKSLYQYKLCYVSPIPKTYPDYTPESKAYMETKEYKERKELLDEERKNKEFYAINLNDWPYNVLEMKQYPHPDYIQGKQNYYAYFTPLELNEQWGNDWDLDPYEYNAEEPHDFYFLPNERRYEFEIIKVPFFLNADNWNIFLPKGETLNYSVQDINNNAVAWIYARGNRTSNNNNPSEKQRQEVMTENGTLIHEGVSILAGDTIQSFKRKMDIINLMYPYNEEDPDEE